VTTKRGKEGQKNYLSEPHLHIHYSDGLEKPHWRSHLLIQDDSLQQVLNWFVNRLIKYGLLTLLSKNGLRLFFSERKLSLWIKIIIKEINKIIYSISSKINKTSRFWGFGVVQSKSIFQILIFLDSKIKNKNVKENELKIKQRKKK
jgi:hypothetical protein